MKTSVLTKELFRNNKIRFALLSIFGLMADAFSLMISIVLMDITDLVAGNGTGEDLKRVAIKTFAVILGVLVTGSVYGVLNANFKKKAMVQYKNKVLSLIAKKDIYAFKGESGALYISALTNDAASIETNYLTGSISLISQSFLFVGALYLMIRANYLLTFITIGLLLIPVAVSIMTGKSLVKCEKEVSDKNADFVENISEILMGFSVVKCFKAEKEVTTVAEASNKSLEKSKCKKNMLTTVIGLIGNIAGAATQFGVFLIGAVIAYKTGSVTAGTLLLFVNLMNNLLAPISSMPSLIAGIKSSKALIKKMTDNLSENSETGTVEIEKDSKLDIELKNVCFSYEEGKEVLHGINQVFSEGKSYALVGGSGSGKSTILKLLMNGSDEYLGSITIGNKEIRDVKTGSLYDFISMIEQEVFVFNSTIRENITMFKEFAKEKIDSAIEKAGLHKLMQEKGEDYSCGDSGSNLSGGERQRISIARSLLLDNKVLLVDEATAALDAETSFHVTNSILDIEGKTKIVVTHDLDAATLKKFDEIITLKDGKIVETGSFKELMDKKEYFYSLFTIAQ